MAQKLVLSVENNKIQMQDFSTFIERMAALKMGPRQEILVDQSSGHFRFTVDIPEKALPKVKQPTKIQVAVEKQINDHLEAVAKEEPVEGHTKALIKTPVKKAKCPVCGVTKPLIRTGAFKTHQSQGQKCSGSGQQPVVSTPVPVERKKEIDAEVTGGTVSPIKKASITIKRQSRRAK